MKISERIRKVTEAPIDKVNRERIRLESEGMEILNLGQAVPDFGPPVKALTELRDNLEKDSMHRYTGDPGLDDLREEIASNLKSKYKVDDANPGEIIITAGANHAFMLALALLCDEGSRWCLFSPYYLNHIMAIHGSGGVVEEIVPDNNLVYDFDKFGMMIQEKKPVAVVIVNPSNPSGRVFTKVELDVIQEICLKNDTWLISDEVYREFVYPPAGMFSIGSLYKAAENTITIGSFSKEFGMTGWRVGWIRAPEITIKHLLKVQDYSIVCAPRAGQFLALSAMRNRPDWARIHHDELQNRMETLVKKLDESNLFEIFKTGGGFFVWFKPKVNVDSDVEVMEIMRTVQVCIMPGTMFGADWKNWFRISFGAQPVNNIKEAADRILAYFQSTDSL